LNEDFCIVKSISQTVNSHLHHRKNDYLEILNLITRRLELQPIWDEGLIEKLCLVFNLIVIKLDNIEKLSELKNYKNLEILLIKVMNFSGKGNSVHENSVSKNLKIDKN
jgi:hypothetical protein